MTAVFWQLKFQFCQDVYVRLHFFVGGHRFILSPSILERSPLMLTPPILSRISDISSPDLATYANTPGGKKLKSRLNELINTLGSSKAGETILSYSPGNDDSLLLSNATQPEFSHIDF